MLNQKGKAVEMTDRGKRGQPNPGCPLFPPPLEITTRFPHFHRRDDDPLFPDQTHRQTHHRKETLPGPAYPGLLRLIFQLENATASGDRDAFSNFH